ncbi:DUF3179 domain-containing protein, partial [Candidatus Roizmanbacteria bacterium]|nr:DUF3179 domain-containing protein [Candidatus Roizmanbacteria bacterium]
DSMVLSRDTGYVRDYNLYPYGTYEQDDEIYFGLKNTDARLPLKEVVYGFDIDGNFKAYPKKSLDRLKIIEDEMSQNMVTVEQKKDGTVVLTDIATGKTYNPLRTFWFAWAAFHPGTEVYLEK